MESRRVILPTIIAVATLLVSIVGATFAYFNVVSGTTGGTATVTATSAEVGSVTMSGTTANLGITLSADNITNAAGGLWYASLDNDFETSKNDKAVVKIANLETTDTPAGVTYKCNFKVTVTPNDTKPVNGLTGGTLYFDSTNVTLKSGDSTVTSVAFTGLGSEVVYDATANLTAGTDGDLSVYATIQSSDTDSTEAWLNGIDGNFTVTADDLVCTAE